MDLKATLIIGLLRIHGVQVGDNQDIFGLQNIQE